MSDQHTIKFTIKQDGTVYEEVYGVKGTGCIDLTDSIENQLGNIQWRKETNDYYQTVDLTQDVTLQYDQDTNKE
tara:strand:+ start:3855 stop:4076 length:222 start_codon:yes stop_codon:yes gene_type:complete